MFYIFKLIIIKIIKYKNALQNKDYVMFLGRISVYKAFRVKLNEALFVKLNLVLTKKFN